jgi:hypothetical protein
MLLIILLGAITFAFSARLIEYASIEREIRNLGRFYRSIGTLEPLNLSNPNIADGVRLITQSRYLYYDEVIVQSGVVMQNVINTDIGGLWSLDPSRWPGAMGEVEGLTYSDVYFTGIVSELNRSGDVFNTVDRNDNFRRYENERNLRIRVDGVIAGYP